MDPNLITGIVGGAAAILGAAIGGGVAAWTAIHTQKKQFELQSAQMRGQLELKARELMFGVYEKTAEDFSNQVKELGGAHGKLGMVLTLPEVSETDKREMVVAFVGTLKSITTPLVERMDDLEEDLNKSGLRDKYGRQFEFVKKTLALIPGDVDIRVVEREYHKITQALAYIADIQHAIVAKKGVDLFREYLPPDFY